MTDSIAEFYGLTIRTAMDTSKSNPFNKKYNGKNSKTTRRMDMLIYDPHINVESH